MTAFFERGRIAAAAIALSGIVLVLCATISLTPADGRRAIPPEFIAPVNGASGVDTNRPFRWTAVPDAERYRLSIGTAPGGNDIVDVAATTTELAVDIQPRRGALYARISAERRGTRAVHSDIAFTTDLKPAPSRMVFPRHGAHDADGGQPFAWSENPLARAYRLTLGSTPGARDLHDSGEIVVTRRFVPGLPTGTTIHGRLETTMATGASRAVSFQFSLGQNEVRPSTKLAHAVWMMDVVRRMADDDDRPFGWSALLRAESRNKYSALCEDYARALLRGFDQSNLGLPSRRVDVGFNPGTRDGHTVVEVWDPDSSAWATLDPDFDLVARKADGRWASADDISRATRSLQWQAISWTAPGPAGDAYVRQYYIDYPLLFANVYERRWWRNVPREAHAPDPYLERVALPADGARAAYAVRCRGARSVAVLIDGEPREIACTGAGTLSSSFVAHSLAAPGSQPGAFDAYRVRRFVFVRPSSETPLDRP